MPDQAIPQIKPCRAASQFATCSDLSWNVGTTLMMSDQHLTGKRPDGCLVTYSCVGYHGKDCVELGWE